METAILLDNKGNTIFTESSGATNVVQFTTEQLSKMKGANLTHNHPGDSTFSAEDILILTTHGLNSIRATSKERTYQLSIVKGSVQKKDFAYDYQKAKQENKKVIDRIYKKYEKQYNNGNISYTEFQLKIPELNRRLNHTNSEWLKNNSKKYGYKYSVIERK